MIEATMEKAVAEAREAHYLRLVEEFDPAIRRLAMTYEREAGQRQDLVQEIWLALWRSLPSFRGDCSERTFVFRIGHNRGVTHIQRSLRRKTEVLDQDAPLVDERVDPEGDVIRQQRQERLRHAVAHLPLGLRQVVVLSLEGLSHREVAEVLGLTENNVAVRLTRARAALLQLLEPSGANR